MKKNIQYSLIALLIFVCISQSIKASWSDYTANLLLNVAPDVLPSALPISTAAGICIGWLADASLKQRIPLGQTIYKNHNIFLYPIILTSIAYAASRYTVKPEHKKAALLTSCLTTGAAAATTICLCGHNPLYGSLLMYMWPISIASILTIFRI